jgi:hypothetical protein
MSQENPQAPADKSPPPPPTKEEEMRLLVRASMACELARGMVDALAGASNGLNPGGLTRLIDAFKGRVPPEANIDAELCSGLVRLELEKPEYHALVKARAQAPAPAPAQPEPRAAMPEPPPPPPGSLEAIAQDYRARFVGAGLHAATDKIVWMPGCPQPAPQELGPGIAGLGTSRIDRQQERFDVLGTVVPGGFRPADQSSLVGIQATLLKQAETAKRAGKGPIL